MTTLSELFDQFVGERTYLNNVTPKTRDWYLTAWSATSTPSRVAGGCIIRIAVHSSSLG